LLDKKCFNSALRSAIFGDFFFAKYSKIEKENSELKFLNRILQLQLNTLKKKNEELTRKQECFDVMKVEFVQLVSEQVLASSRLYHILDIIKDL